jgi:hypothetical protein
MRTLESLEDSTISQANKQLIAKMLYLITNESENSNQTIQCLTDDCVWIIHPGGIKYQGIGEIKAFVEAAIKGRSHDEQHKIQILNWFAENESLCIEYTHGAKFTGKTFTRGVKFDVDTGILQYCLTYRLCDGKFNEVHEYITSTSWLWNILLPLFLKNLYRKSKKYFPKST